MYIYIGKYRYYSIGYVSPRSPRNVIYLNGVYEYQNIGAYFYASSIYGVRNG